MSKFEVHIPAADAGGFAMTLKVNADNWMAALKAGMAKLGEQGSAVQNVLVDIQEDNSIHVTESRSGRVFRIRELSEEEAAKATVKRPSNVRNIPNTAPQNPPRSQSGSGAGNAAGEVADTSKTMPAMPAYRPEQKGGNEERTEQGRAFTADDQTDKGQNLRARADTDKPSKPDNTSDPKLEQTTKPPARRPAKSSPRIEVEKLQIEELEHPTKPITGSIGRKKSPTLSGKGEGAPVEDLLADVFMRVQEIQNKKQEDALYFVLDLALEKVPADAGSVLFADGASGDLHFAAARGPKAKELLKSNIVVPAGTGFAGFCAAEGVAVAISDVEKDPRYYGEVAEKVDYETQSLICAPMMTHGRSFGCLQLINRKGGTHFAEHEVGILSYLAHQAALYLNDRD